MFNIQRLILLILVKIGISADEESLLHSPPEPVLLPSNSSAAFPVNVWSSSMVCCTIPNHSIQVFMTVFPFGVQLVSIRFTDNSKHKPESRTLGSYAEGMTHHAEGSAITVTVKLC